MNKKVKTIFGIIFKIITWLIVAFAVFMMVFTIINVTTVNKNDRSIFGYRFYIVQTDSMSKSENNADMKVHFNAGDIVIIKNVKEPDKLQAGDIISFLSTNEVSYGETITHMIREVKTNTSGNVMGYVTFGTNTGVNDEAIVEPMFVLGKYSGKIPYAGNFFAFVKSTPGYIVCILIPFLLLILYNGFNVVRLFRRYRKEQTEAIDAERAQIAAERKQNEDMMKELMELKARLEHETSVVNCESEEDTKEETNKDKSET